MEKRGKKRAVGALGKLLSATRKRLDVSKYAIEQWTTSRERAGLNHTVLQRLEIGSRYTLAYETLWRAIEGINGCSQKGQVGALDIRDHFNAAFVDHLCYEAAKYIVYYFYVTNLDMDHPEILPEELRLMRAAMLRDGITGEAITQRGRAPRMIVGKGARPRATQTTLADTHGFEAVRIMAEIPEGHAYRLALLVEHFPGLRADWESGDVEIMAASPLAGMAQYAEG